jgi:hypothetical protein
LIGRHSLHPACGNFCFPDMDQAIQESAGGQHHSSRKYLFSARQPDADHAPFLQN